MSIIKWIFKGKIIQKRPCEKVSFVFAAALFFFGFFLYLIYTNQYTLPSSYFYLAGFTVVAGYIGVLYYRIMHNKHPYFIFNPWKKY